MSGNYTKLCAGKFGFAFGLIGGIGFLLLGWAAWLWSFGVPFVQLVSHVYIGYAPTFIGALWGALWAFIDYFVFAWLVALVYNCCCRCCSRS